MFQTFVVSLREGIEIALVMGIILAYLQKIGRPELTRWAWGGFVAALLPSIAGALWLSDALSALKINEEVYEGVLMLVAAFFVGTLLVWMWKAGRHLKAEMEGRMAHLTGAGAAGFGIAAFAFVTVFREGVELLLFMNGFQATSAHFQKVEGFLLGGGLALLFGVAFIRGTVRVNLAKFFTVTSVLLGFLTLQLLVGGIHELSEAQLLPASRAEMAVIGPIVNDTGGHLYLFAAVLVLSVLWVTFASSQGGGPAPARAPAPASVSAGGVAATAANPAEQRKVLARARSEKAWRVTLAAVGLAGGVLLLGSSAHMAPPARSEAEVLPQEAGGNVLRVPLAPLEDGKLHFYRTTAAGGEVRLLALKTGDGAYAVTLDACQICGPEGYYQEEDQVICRHCGAPILVSTIGAEGGCNPIKVEAAVREGSLVFSLADVERSCEHVSK
ncbi:MAG: DUF2318 domain-containing protein [Planctomycetes bacterium]|nr:DUF2318 domain-containing protein [Planctomycetota bacterium]